MKVGILTLPLWHNYGGILQAYALREAISRLGTEAVFVDVQRRPVPLLSQTWNFFKRSVKGCLPMYRSAPFYPTRAELSYISVNTRRFVTNRIRPAAGPVTFQELPQLNPQFDAWVVGSDQIWRPEYAPDLEAYFLGFADRNARKISYAASLGTSDWRFSSIQTSRCSELLRKFDAVSVRENSAVQLVEDNLGVKPAQVCDPTLLLDAEDYISLLSDKAEGVSGGRGCFMYVLDSHDKRVENLAALMAEMGIESFGVMPKSFGRGFSSEKIDYVFPSVDKWILAFKECDRVLTDSFHGCVFSIIFNKPFIAIANEERGRARFESLLEGFGLQDRLVSSADEIDRAVFEKGIDWNSVNYRRMAMQKDGIDFLMKSLESKR